jgi:hypothetical protein
MITRSSLTLLFLKLQFGFSSQTGNSIGNFRGTCSLRYRSFSFSWRSCSLIIQMSGSAVFDRYCLSNADIVTPNNKFTAFAPLNPIILSVSALAKVLGAFLFENSYDSDSKK